MELKPGAHVHLMGVCGTAMGSLAGLLQSKGFKVTGSDQNVYPPMSTQLESLGIQIMSGYKAENLASKPDFVVVGNVIPKSNPEAQALLSSKIPYTSLPKTIGEHVIEGRHSIVISGTHGKTTTTSLMSWVLDQANLKPGFLIGGIAQNFSKSFRLSGGDWFVIEGDEYDTAFFDKVPKFVHYKPKSAILTSIEFDHADIYDSIEQIKMEFIKLLKLIPKDDGLLVYNNDDQNINAILSNANCRLVSYGSKDADWQYGNISFVREGIEFDLKYKGHPERKVFLPMFGDYNAMNAAAVYALVKTLDMNVDLNEAFASFKGIKRRQELLGSPNGIQVIEDFAHHPTAVKYTVHTFNQRKGEGRVFAIFEPRSATSRRNIFQQQYLEALSGADVVLMPKPFNQTNIAENKRFSSEELVEGLSKKGVSAFLCEDVADIVTKVKDQAKPKDIVVIMSNGGFDDIYGKLLSSL